MPTPAADRCTRLLRAFTKRRHPATLGEVFTGAAATLLHAAERVTRDREAAEDAVQEAFLAVLRGEACFDARRPALPWLRGLVANKARHLRRRAMLREDSVAPVDIGSLAAPALDDSSAREQRQRLREALRGLPATYREVVRRRYISGEAAPAIARDLDLANASVRARLRRALRLLRSALRAMVALLAMSLFGRRARAASVPLVVGGLFAAAWWLSQAEGVDPPPVLAASTTPPVPVGDPRGAAAGRDAAATVADATSLPRRRVQLLFADGQPAAHVGVRATNAGEDFDASVQRAATDELGQVELPPGTTWRTDRGPSFAAPAGDADRDALPQVRLPVAGGRQRVRVVDTSGAPCQGVGIWLADGVGAWDGTVVATTDRDGCVDLAALPVGAHLAALQPGVGASALVAVGSEPLLSLRLHLACRVATGRVVDASGRPIAGARVRPPGGASMQLVLPGNLTVAGEPAVVAHADANGAFTAVVVGDGPHQLLVRAPGFAPRLIDVRIGEPRTVVLEPGGSLRGIATTEQGAPVAEARVLLRGASWYDRAGAFTAADGAFSFDALGTGLADIEIVARGRSPWRGTVDLRDAEAVSLRCTLAETAVVRVPVRSVVDGGAHAVEAAVRPRAGSDRMPSFVHRPDATGDLALPGDGGELIARRGPRSPWVALADDAQGATIDPALVGSARVAAQLIDAAGNEVALTGISCRDALGVSVLACERRGDRWITGLLPAGDHELTFLPASANVAPLVQRVNGLSPGEERDLGVLLAPGRVECSVVLDCPAPFDVGLVVLRDAADLLVASTIVHDRAVLHVPAGSYRLAVFGRTTEWRCSVPFEVGATGATARVSLRPGVRRTIVVRGLQEGTRRRVEVRRAAIGGQIVFADTLVVDEGGTLRWDALLGDGEFVLGIDGPSAVPCSATFHFATGDEAIELAFAESLAK